MSSAWFVHSAVGQCEFCFRLRGMDKIAYLKASVLYASRKNAVKQKSLIDYGYAYVIRSS
jgi:hypothetical protein